MVDAAPRLEAGGAEFLLICTNTMHKLVPMVEDAIGIPLLHIADPTAIRIKAAGLRAVGLQGTAFTMEQDFYKVRLTDRHGLTVLTPSEADRALVYQVIYEELVAGKINAASKVAFRSILQRLADAGAEAVILGFTEIMLLVRPDDSPVPVFDTTTIHAEAAVSRALDWCI